jgi:hypothetical protein
MVFERLMETHWIAKGFDVLEHRYFGVIEILVALEFGPFMLQRPEESFCNCIVITAPSSARGPDHHLAAEEKNPQTRPL